MHLTEDLTTKLQDRFGERFRTGAAICGHHGAMATSLATQPPDAVVFPETPEEVAEIVRLCAEAGAAVIPFGAGSSLEGQVNAPFGGISVDLTQMNRIVAVNPDDMDVVVQPGVTRKQLNTHLRDTGLFFPLDPGADATLGGMASTRASGTTAVRYGTMRDVVLALQVVMPDGKIIRTGSRARKSAAGYDLTRLLVGSEGTLGIITELTLRLQPIPEAVQALRCSFPTTAAACETTIAALQCALPLARIELLDAVTVGAVNVYSDLALPETPMLLVELHGSPSGVVETAQTFCEIAEGFGATAIVEASTNEDRTKLWQARHDVFWAVCAMRPGAKSISTDVCVPVSRLAECIAAAEQRVTEIGLIAPIAGHVGDGNFHHLILLDPENQAEQTAANEYIGWLNDLAISLGGTCSGEHGIGQGKRRYLALEAGEALHVMAAIKRALDPKGIMNPGKILPDTATPAG